MRTIEEMGDKVVEIEKENAVVRESLEQQEKRFQSNERWMRALFGAFVTITITLISAAIGCAFWIVNEIQKIGG